MQNTPVEFFDIVWRVYIIDYDVDPPHRFFTNITPWPANATLRETYEDDSIDFFEVFIELNALRRVEHSGLDGETYNTMIAREFKARGIKERLQIYRKLPSADDESEITSVDNECVVNIFTSHYEWIRKIFRIYCANRHLLNPTPCPTPRPTPRPIPRPQCGSYEVFNQRPIPEEIISYCIGDARYLPKLRDRFWKTQAFSVARSGQ